MGEARHDVVADDAVSAALISHCRALLARYKTPRSIEFIAEVPRTSTGTIQKKALRAPYWVDADRKI